MSRIRARIPVGTLFIDAGVTAIDNVVPVQLSAALGQDVNEIDVVDLTGGSKGLKLWIGPAGGEVLVMQFSPGADKKYGCLLNKGMRISVTTSGAAPVALGTLTIGLFQ